MEREMEFRRGDRLKTRRLSGPTMVVTDVYARYYIFRYHCTWTDEHGREQSEVYRARDLELVS